MEENPDSPTASRSRRRKRSPELPLWLSIGDGLAEAIIWIILAGGFLTEGYVVMPHIRSLAWGACGLLGLWAAVGIFVGRLNGPRFGAIRLCMVLMLIPVIWGGLQLVPLPSELVTPISATWRETKEAYQGAALTFPENIPLAQSPVNAMRSWSQMVAALFFFSAVGILTTRRRCSIRLILLVCLVSLIECMWGLSNHAFRHIRPHGAVYNSNHHAALILMGLPLYFSRLIQWKRFSPGMQDTPLLSGSNPLLLFFAVGLLAIVGWVSTLSRGSLMFGGGIFLLWILIEVWGAWREMRTHSNIQTTPETIIVGGAGMLVMILALTILIFSTSSLERVVERGGVSDELRERGRLELWRASLEALGHSPWLGLGLGGAEAALNRYSVLPMATVAVWSHNDYVQFLAEMGIPVASVCLLALAALLSRLTADLVRHLRQYPWSQGMMQRSAMTGVLITLAHSITDFHLRIPLVGFTFLILLGLAVNSGALLISPRMYARLVDLEVFMRPLRWLRILESHRSD